MDGHEAKAKAKHHREGPEDVFAINGEHVASSCRDGVIIRRLKDTDPILRHIIRYRPAQPRYGSILVFHPTRLNLLAAANGSQILILDLDKRNARHILKGNGRVVTSLAWAEQEPKTLASGTVDGAICIWSLRSTSRPLHQFRGLKGPCEGVAFNSDDWRILTTYHRGTLSVWKISQQRPLFRIGCETTRLKLFCWTGGRNGDLVVVTHDGDVTLIKCMKAVDDHRVARPLQNGYDSEDETPIQQELSDAAVSMSIGFPVRQTSILGSNGLVILPEKSTNLYFYAWSTEHRESGHLVELWRLHSDLHVDSFAVLVPGKSVQVLVCHSSSSQEYNVPEQVLDGMGWWPDRNVQLTQTTRISNVKASITSGGAMRPEKCLRQRHHESNPLNLSAVRYPLTKELHKPSKLESRKSLRRKPPSRPQTPPSQDTTSNLELSKPAENEEEQESPMPFLSPAIPARKASPISSPALTLLDENIPLPSRASPDSMQATMTDGNQSDSDDESFAEDMQGSSSFLPGGVNVPLPRSCGAAFAHNGQLLVFIPTRTPDRDVPERAEMRHTATIDTRSIEAAKLFPGFGNFASSSPTKDSVIGSESDEGPETVPRFTVQPSSFESRLSWVQNVSPVKTMSSTAPSSGRITVAVHDIEQFMPVRRSLASKYSIAPNDGETYTDVCRSNAAHAEGEGLREAYDAWLLLALLLEQRKVLDRDVGNTKHELSVKSSFEERATTLVPQPTTPSVSELSLHDMLSSPALLTCPLGQKWALMRILIWAEVHGDLQQLATVSAVMVMALQSLENNARTRAHRAHTVRSNSYEVDTAETDFRVTDPPRFPRSIPMLRANSNRSNYSLDSPRKRHGSQASSRDPSQPGTPYIDSSGSTPPLTFPPLPRPNARLSTSGSASPENQRSSFSIAAKNYAASIAEKFSSYGSSPPSKKLGASPGNELSSSLPDRSTGSWSKTVSFASNLDAVHTSRRSFSLAQEDDHYDSDRTLDDPTLPQTPKHGESGVVFKVKSDRFFGEGPVSTAEALATTNLADKGHAWRLRYADYLRSLELLTEATELEDTVPSLDDDHSRKPRQDTYGCLLPEATLGRFAECSICFCIIKTAEQLCPICLHATHPTCINELISASIDDDDFTCPTGCGCSCTLTSNPETSRRAIEDFPGAALDQNTTATEEE